MQAITSVKRAALAAAVTIFLSSAIFVRAADKPDANGAAAFARLKTLVGTWEATGRKSGTATSTFESVASGSAIIERVKMPGESEMVTMYHLDGNRLVLTHYCTAGNQPHMQVESFDPASNQLAFNFAGGGNLANPNAGHMHHAVLTFGGADDFQYAWTFQKDGKAQFTENLQYHRVK
jgi:hypothetical protein